MGNMPGYHDEEDVKRKKMALYNWWPFIDTVIASGLVQDMVVTITEEDNAST
ncbi:hypothetical protein LCGC14_1967310 [marine sediment metagenome]|uniref:Uncharacterized protein n=1 Tax=marine sediment metagenome TaxID=412755 RepID=A0A0F9G117_9ZZZZ